MRTYARIQDGVIAELLKTDGDMTSMFNPALVWVDVSGYHDVAEGWHFNGTDFNPPPAHPPAATVPTIAELRTQLAAINAQLEVLSGKCC